MPDTHINLVDPGPSHEIAFHEQNEKEIAKLRRVFGPIRTRFHYSEWPKSWAGVLKRS